MTRYQAEVTARVSFRLTGDYNNEEDARKEAEAFLQILHGNKLGFGGDVDQVGTVIIDFSPTAGERIAVEPLP